MTGLLFEPDGGFGAPIGSDRAHDLINLQLIAPMTDEALVASKGKRLFKFRAEHPWPPTAAVGTGWESLCDEAAEGLDFLPNVGGGRLPQCTRQRLAQRRLP